VKVVPYYDRSSLVSVTTHTILHNLVFGCILVFFIQWLFLGDLRSAIIVSANIPFALFFAIILLVLRGEDANLLSLGAVDFGIIVDSAVILVENIFRNFQAKKSERRTLLDSLMQGHWGPDPTSSTGSHGSGRRWSKRLRLLFISGLQVNQAILFTSTITVTAFVPLFTMQGVEGKIFGPMARTYGYALAGALLATFTITPVLASFMIPRKIEKGETIFVRTLRAVYTPLLEWSLGRLAISIAIKFSVRGRDLGSTVAEAQALIAKNVKLPTGYRILWSGEFEDLERANARLAVIVPITFLLIMVLLYALFNSLRDSLLSIAGIPFAVAGGILALYFSGQPFSVSAAIGFISLSPRGVRHGRHLEHHLLPRIKDPRHGGCRSGLPRSGTADAAVVNDGAFRGRRPIPGGNLTWHRQSGAAAPRHGCRRRHDNWTLYVADRRARASSAIP
jgi:Cu/Ag efflux pump CusA